MDVVPVLAKEIVSRFRKLTGGDPTKSITTDLAAFVVRVSLFGSADKDEKGNVALSPEGIESVAANVSRYLAECSPHEMATLSLQCQTHGLRAAVAQRRRAEAVKQEAITVRLLASLCENTTRTPEEILSEIAFYILHAYGQLGGDAGATVRGETAAILASVLPRAQVRAFASQSAPEKRRQLEELRRIVWGLRLYHFAEGRGGGDGLIDPRAAAERAAADTTTRIASALDETAASVASYTAALRAPSAALSADRRRAVTVEQRRRLQCLLNLRDARRRADAIAAHGRDVLLPAFDAALAALRSALGPSGGRDGLRLRADVSRRTLFPLAVALADAYAAAVDGAGGLAEVGALVDVSVALGAVPRPSLPPALAEGAAADARAPSPVDRDGLRLVRGYARDAAALAAMGPSAPALRRLCPVTLVEEGVAAEGGADEAETAFAGFVRLASARGGRGRWYAFRSAAALRRFAARPAHYTEAIARAAAEEVVLVGLLDLFEDVPREVYIAGTRQYETRDAIAADAETPTKRCEAAVQTGQIDPYMDHNYRWNEWDLRRQALKLANLFNMRTHSTQTIASHFRRDNATQVRPPRDDATQTMQDAAVQPARTVQYLKGLRGTETSAIETVRRTFLY